MNHHVRKSRPEDHEKIWDLISYAYGIPYSSHDSILERMETTGHEFYVITVNEDPVAVARLLPFEQNIRGILKPMGGIGMVASSPEFRRQGYTRELMNELLKLMKKQNYATSTLYPFKDTFYGDFGYCKIPPSINLEFDPSNLSRIVKPNGYEARRETGEEALSIWRELQELVVERTHGAVKRSDARWDELTVKFNRKIVVARNQDGRPEAVMVYSIKGYGEGHPWAATGEMNIGEMHWRNIEGRDTLLHYIYGHADQIKNVKLEISINSQDYYQWLSNYHTPKISSRIISMARIIDVKSSLQGLRVYEPGSLTLRIVDPIIESNNGVFNIFEKDGLLQVEEFDEETNTILSIEGLTAILYGTLNIQQLRRLEWLKGDHSQFSGRRVVSEDGVTYVGILSLDDWFPLATPWLTEDF